MRVIWQEFQQEFEYIHSPMRYHCEHTEQNITSFHTLTFTFPWWNMQLKDVSDSVLSLSQACSVDLSHCSGECLQQSFVHILLFKWPFSLCTKVGCKSSEHQVTDTHNTKTLGLWPWTFCFSAQLFLRLQNLAVHWSTPGPLRGFRKPLSPALHDNNKFT